MGQPSNVTTKQLDNPTPGQPDNGTTQQWDNLTMGQPITKKT